MTSMQDEIRSRVVIDADGCWIWRGRVDPAGLARVGRNGVAHRESYAAFVGSLAPGHVIAHTCAIALCVNPDHLEQRVRHEDIATRLRKSSVQAPSGCWIWVGTRNPEGYGAIRSNGKMRRVHRVSYEIATGRPIPAGLQIDHLCRRRACIRPDHLQLVTPRENFLRGTATGARAIRRQACLHGHPHSEFKVYWAGRPYCRECHRLASIRLRETRKASAA